MISLSFYELGIKVLRADLLSHGQLHQPLYPKVFGALETHRKLATWQRLQRKVN